MHRRVLLVEDSAKLRLLIELILHQGGYEVVVASDAESTLRILNEQGCKFDAMLMDIMLPDSSGVELAESARTICPQLTTLLMSGFDFEMPDGMEFISKPFSPDQLLSRLSKLIG